MGWVGSRRRGMISAAEGEVATYSGDSKVASQWYHNLTHVGQGGCGSGSHVWVQRCIGQAQQWMTSWNGFSVMYIEHRSEGRRCPKPIGQRVRLDDDAP